MIHQWIGFDIRTWKYFPLSASTDPDLVLGHDSINIKELVEIIAMSNLFDYLSEAYIAEVDFYAVCCCLL